MCAGGQMLLEKPPLPFPLPLSSCSIFSAVLPFSWTAILSSSFSSQSFLAFIHSFHHAVSSSCIFLCLSLSSWCLFFSIYLYVAISFSIILLNRLSNSSLCPATCLSNLPNSSCRHVTLSHSSFSSIPPFPLHHFFLHLQYLLVL